MRQDDAQSDGAGCSDSPCLADFASKYRRPRDQAWPHAQWPVNRQQRGSTVERGGNSGKRLVLATLGVVGALVFAGCDWPMFGFNAGLTHSSPDTSISSANIATLQPLF